MKFLNDDQSFWATIVLAAFIKAGFSNYASMRIGVASFAAAIFVPFVGTNPLLTWLGWDYQSYVIITAALLAWLGENVVKGISALDIDRVISLLRGGAK